MIESYSWPVKIDTEGGFPVVRSLSEILIEDWEKERPGVPWILTLRIDERKTEPPDASRN